MAKTTVEIPDQKMAELEAYRDRLGELLLLGCCLRSKFRKPCCSTSGDLYQLAGQQNSPI